MPTHLAFAGHAIAFAADHAESPFLASAFDSFVTDQVLPIAAHYRVLGPDTHPTWSNSAGDCIWRTETWRLCRSQDDGFVLALHVLPDEHPLPVAWFSRDFTRGELLRRAGRHGAATPFAFNYPCDQVATLNALNPRGIGIVHAGGVAFNEDGFLFCGRSGAGKTTLSRLCRDAGATLLNDDRQFVWRDENGTWIAPTPWHGLEPEINNRTVRLRAVFHLEQAPVDRTHELAPMEAVTRLLGNTVAPFYRVDAMERTLAWAEAVTAAVPSFHLEFTPSQTAVTCCRSAAGLSAIGG